MPIDDLYDVVDGDLNDDPIDGPDDEEVYDTIDGDLTLEMDMDGEIEVPQAYFGKSYLPLDDKPSINGHVLIGDQTSEDLEIETALTEELDVTKAVGGVPKGTVYPQGTSLEQIMREMFNPVEYPTFTTPSASISATGAKLLERGYVLNSVVTVNFSRGTINPAYGTSGHRSGPAYAYSINGGAEQASNSFFYAITQDNNTIQAKVKYSEGEQPKDSIGNDYDEPYPAGQVQSGVSTWEFVNALWANTANIQEVAKLALVSKSVRQKEFIFPDQTVQHPETFDVPGDWTVTAVEVLNPLNQKWEDASHEFDITTVTHYDAGGVEVEYNRYKDNRGYNAGSRSIRIKWA